MKHTFIIVLAAFIFQGCVKDKPQAAVQPAVQLSTFKKVYVINEGGFGYNQASVSLYDPATAQVIEDFYKTRNNLLLGDVAQSMSLINGKYYIVVNNSGRIIVCDAQLKKTDQITNLTSPRYMLQVTNKKAYVSDFSANAISIVDLNTNTKTGAIPCSGWTEKMVVIYNKAFVTNPRADYVYVINTVTDTKIDSINVGKNAGNIVIDKYDHVWVLNSGDAAGEESARLIKINPLTNTLELSLTFAGGALPGNLCMNNTKDTLYYIDKDVFRFSVSDNTLPNTPFIKANGRNFYGLGIHPDNHTVYAADALDYIQRANIYIYDMSGKEISFFKAGLISNGFYFE